MALAVVAGSGVFVPAISRPLLAGAVVAGVVLALAQDSAARTRPRLAEWFVLPHVAVWTLLLHAAGGQSSPLFVGYLLELPLAGASSSPRGVLLAAGLGIAAYLSYAIWLDSPLQAGAAITVCGFVAVCGALTWLVIAAILRQQRAIESSRRALEDRAESLTEELRLLGDYLTGALVGIDASGRVASINRAGLTLLGCSDRSILDSPWQEALQPDPESRCRIASTLADGQPLRGATIVLRRSDGRSCTARAEMWLSPTTEGRRAYLLLDPPGSSAGAEDPVRRLGEAAACVAHQIKNSIHALEGFARELNVPGGRVAGIKSDRYLGALHSLGTLAEDVLAMAGASRQRQENVSLAEVLDSALLLVNADRGKTRVSVQPRDLSVHACRSQLLHALFNLLDNAARVSSPSATIEVRARREDHCVRIEIQDQGPGLPCELTETDGPVDSRTGTGLGLMAARRFVRANGGRLAFMNAEPCGTCIHLEFPEAVSDQ